MSPQHVSFELGAVEHVSPAGIHAGGGGGACVVGGGGACVVEIVAVDGGGGDVELVKLVMLDKTHL